jgi:hypothetical protein
MTPCLPRTLSVFCLACLVNATWAEERKAPIRDDAKLFHAAAIEQAKQRIADIHRTFDRNVFVRTVESVSPQPRRWFPFLRTPQVNQMLELQARKFASERGVPGIYVVICTHPRDVHIIVRPEDDPEFSRRDAETLRRTLARGLHDRGADAALLGFLDQLNDVLQDHATRGPSTLVNDVLVAGLLGGGLGLWLLLRLIRFKMRRNRPATAWDAGSINESGTQARETAALLGAMFGYPAGLWIYDKLYPCPPGATPLCQPLAGDEEKSAKIEGDQHPLPEPAEDAPVSH